MINLNDPLAVKHASQENRRIRLASSKHTKNRCRNRREVIRLAQGEFRG